MQKRPTEPTKQTCSQKNTDTRERTIEKRPTEYKRDLQNTKETYRVQKRPTYKQTQAKGRCAKETYMTKETYMI